ncbi:NAD(P)H-binding protein [Namhaeicola litoreus]|uniref:NAD(P)H-binding protein n=1 Tax=Namhaeicola litoreus TaxID=1052145 RepID=A0ABW3Y3L7_9FLAO
MDKTAIILGASGLTGSELLKILLEDESYTKVKVFGRSRLEENHPKLEQFIGDLFKLEEFSQSFKADEVFCCIGTTAKKTPDKTIYKAIDYGIPVNAASLAKLNDINFFAVVSAMGANAKSNIFYNKTKGEMEQEVLKVNIPFTYILRPSLILGKRNEKRLAESWAKTLFEELSFIFMGPLKKYRPNPAENIAQKMRQLAQNRPPSKIIFAEEINEVAELGYDN